MRSLDQLLAALVQENREESTAILWREITVHSLDDSALRTDTAVLPRPGEERS